MNVNPGVVTERLVPDGAAFHPTCPPTTLIGTVTTPRITARTEPRSTAPAIATFRRVNAQRARQVFDLIGELEGHGGRTWYRALLPVRPNNTVGYVPGNELRTTWTGYWLLVERSRFTVSLYRECDLVARFPVGVGTGETPTPVGYFYLQSLLRPPESDSVYGTYAYGLSGYSDVIRDWRWGGVVGLHGTNDPSSIGRYVSHGCIRMYNADIERLVRILPLGTPIAIV